MKHVIFVLQSRHPIQRELLAVLKSIDTIEVHSFFCMNCAMKFIESDENVDLLIFGNRHDGCRKHDGETLCINLYRENIIENQKYKNITIVIFPARTDIKRNLLRKQDHPLMLGASFTRVMNVIYQKLNGQEQ